VVDYCDADGVQDELMRDQDGGKCSIGVGDLSVQKRQ
jgi:hypothetical protein